MSLTVEAAFDEFFENINLPGDHRETANARRDDIVSILRKNLNVVESFPSGSIPRFTALKGKSDLDLMVALHYGQHIKARKPSEVLQSVRDVLAEYRTNVRKNGQAVTLYYKTWPNVDIVPAAQVTDGGQNVVAYEIPDMNREVWLSSRPKQHSAAIEEKSTSCGPLFRKLTKMMKHWNLRHSEYMQSYHVEAIACQSIAGWLQNTPWEMFQFFDKAAKSLSGSLHYNGSVVDDYLTYGDRSELVKRLNSATETARDAWYATYPPRSDHKAAIERWGQVFIDQFPKYG